MSFFEELKRRNVFRVGIAYGVATWLLIQVTDTVFPRIGLPDSAVTLVIALLAIGFIPAIIIAWAYEMTPEGLKRESDVDRTESITPQTSKKLDRIIIAGLVLIIIGMGIERTWFAGTDDTAPQTNAVSSETALLDQAKTIAVLPFVDMSQQQDQEWFSDGLAEEILNALARAPDLLVSSRTSSFAYKGTNTPIAQIAAELGVAHVLEGSVRRAGDRIRVTAQLIRTADGFHLWSENYDRDADDIISIQEELAINIAKALKTTMDPKALQQMLTAGTRSVEAFEHYLNGLSLEARAWDESGWDSFLAANEAFESARTVDPGFAAAHYQAAVFWYNQVSVSRRPSGLVSVSQAEKMAAFRERTTRAIETTGNPVDRMKYEASLARVEARFRDAIALALKVMDNRPFDFANVELLLEASQDANDLETQLRAFRHAYELRQNGPDWLRVAISASMRLTFSGGDTGLDNVAWIMDSMRKSGKPSPAYQAHRALLWFGQTDKAREMLPYLADESPDARVMIDSRQACAEGRRSEAERILASVPKDWTPERKASTLWHIHQMLGQHQQAAALLKPFESAESPLTLMGFLGYPDFDPAPFPLVMSIMQREGIKRAPPVKIPFACPDQDVILQESVAVLPFASMSSGEDDGYFADGLTEEILNSLAALPELLVTARTSSFHFKGQNLPVQQIASTLGVNHIVEGSVRRAGENVRITAQLIRARDGFHLWSDTYDRTLEDVFAVQEEIAHNIAETLDIVLDKDKLELMRQAGINDVQAFIDFQKGRDLFVQAHATENPIVGLREANKYLDRVIAKAPRFTNAMLMRSDMYGHIIFNNAANLEPADQSALESARDEILKSLEASARYTHSPAERANLEGERLYFTDDWTAIPSKIEAALDSEECFQMNWLPTLAGVFGWVDALVAHHERSRACDPLNGLVTTMIVYYQIWAGDAQSAYETADQYLNSHDFNAWTDDGRFLASLVTGRYRDIPESYGPNPEGSNFLLPRAIFAHAMDNNLEAARNLFDKYIAQSPWDDQSRLFVAAALGDRTLANQAAAAIDARFLGPFMLAETTKACLCGALFDIDVTPNFKARITEAGFDWPPVTPIKFPAKDW